MHARSSAVALLGLCLGACAAANDSDSLDPGLPAKGPPIARTVVDAGLVIFNSEAGIYNPGGGGAGLLTPDAGAGRDLEPTEPDAPTKEPGGLNASCDVFANDACAGGYGCYPKTDGTGTCQQAGFLPGGSRCEPASSSPDSRCVPGSVCVDGLCTGLCHPGQVATRECRDSIGINCVRWGISDTVGYCATN